MDTWIFNLSHGNEKNSQIVDLFFVFFCLVSFVRLEFYEIKHDPPGCKTIFVYLKPNGSAMQFNNY